MRVEWDEIHEPPYGDEYHDYIPPLVKFSGEVIGTVNTFFGGTKLVVMLDSGKTREVPANEVRREALREAGVIVKLPTRTVTWTCADKSRTLLSSEDGKTHYCHKPQLGH